MESGWNSAECVVDPLGGLELADSEVSLLVGVSQIFLPVLNMEVIFPLI